MSRTINHGDFPAIWDEVEQAIGWDIKMKRRNRFIIHGALAVFGMLCAIFGCMLSFYLNEGEAKYTTVISTFGGQLDALFPSAMPAWLRPIAAACLPLVGSFVVALLLKLVSLAIPGGYTLTEGAHSLRNVEAGEEIYRLTSRRLLPYEGEDFTHWTHTLIYLLCVCLPVIGHVLLFSAKLDVNATIFWSLIPIILLIGFLPMLALRKLSLWLNCLLLCKENKCYPLSEAAEKYVDLCVDEAKKERDRQHKAARQREKDSQKKDAAALYESAVAGEEVNQRLMRQAAELGHPKACFYIGKQQYQQTGSETLTKTEREEAMERICCFFDDAYKGGVEQAQFYSILCRVEYEENTQDDWQKMLDTLRRMKADGEVPEGMEPACDEAIGYIVECIDRMEVKREQKRQEEARKRWEEAQKPTPAEYRKKALALEAAGHYSDAKRHFKLAAEGGDSLGMDNYARHCLIDGNRSLAIYWLEKSIATGEYDDLSVKLLRALKNGEHVNVSYYEG